MKKIAVLGLTGSVGLSTVEVVRAHPDQFQIVFACSHNNYNQLFRLVEEFAIPEIVLTNPKLAKQITDFPANCRVSFGMENLIDKLSEIDCDLVLNAITGSAGLQSSITTLQNGIDLALANKESLVMAGHLIKPLLKKSGKKILPVDSEHSAIFQAIGNAPSHQIRNLILTASGGPFRNLPFDKFAEISIADTLNHPTWNMGAKVTIDSATMLNKGLEVIEAHWLFDVEYEQILAVIHPQSIIHSLVEFRDGSILAQMSLPSMQLPILYALSYPERIESNLLKTTIRDLPNISFDQIDAKRYPLYFLARKTGKEGGILPTTMNAANEAAIELFLQHKIAFTDIAKIVQKVIESAENISNPTLAEILENNRETHLKTLQDFAKLI
ncbi:MAG TPA: 1-deoxy-D-xylulose-5-phosphate reductoisomerase [Candidatus Cloacimonadota bacterium]|nr:1-deoxy-D-xylulose-5-phosphate reductoisomerase [Candidatus Cloacimonadota bacterium]